MSGDIPALESGAPDGGMLGGMTLPLEGGFLGGMLGGGMSLPVGMRRRALSYDDNMEAPMSPPPSDITIHKHWRRPVIPDRKFHNLAEEEESDTHTASWTAGPASSRHSLPVVKTKASSVIMNSLMTKQTQDSMYNFEQKAGLSDTGYTPHKGLMAEETRHHHRMPESFHKMQIQSVDQKEEKQDVSAQSSPSSTPQTSPRHTRRSWFGQGSGASLTSDLSSSSSVDLGLGEGGAGGAGASGGAAGAMERWGRFGPRLVVQKSTTDPGGMALQPYMGGQKTTPMELMKAQATRLADGPVANPAAPPTIEIPPTGGRSQASRPHKLNPRDMNVLTPSGF